MKKCKVFALVSEYETPGIAALEAGLQGANCLLTKIGGATEYFEKFATYVNPFSFNSVENGLRLALESPPETNLLPAHISDNYSWSIVAKKTLECYKKVLDK